MVENVQLNVELIVIKPTLSLSAVFLFKEHSNDFLARK